MSAVFPGSGETVCSDLSVWLLPLFCDDLRGLSLFSAVWPDDTLKSIASEPKLKLWGISCKIKQQLERTLFSHSFENALQETEHSGKTMLANKACNWQFAWLLLHTTVQGKRSYTKILSLSLKNQCLKRDREHFCA
jgi:hypothetical protein